MNVADITASVDAYVKNIETNRPVPTIVAVVDTTEPQEGYSWKVQLTVPVTQTSITLTVIAKRIRKSNIQFSSSMRKKKKLHQRKRG